MKLSIMVEDGAVIKDGEGLVGVSLVGVPDNVRALQWDNGKGHIEFVEDEVSEELIDTLPRWAEDAAGTMVSKRAAIEVAENPPITEHEAARQQAKYDYGLKLRNIIYTFPNGKVIQCRPRDLINLRLAVEEGTSEEWIMEDNSLSTLSVEEMQQALDYGTSLSKKYRNEYKDSLRELAGSI